VIDRSIFVGLALLMLLVPALSQQTPSDTTANFIFRMARLEGSDASCVIVQNDGQFHLERTRRKSVEVFEGTLTPDDLATLHALLNDDHFVQLLPEAVSSSLLPTGLDEVALSIPRDQHWMTLRFLSGVSSDRNRSLLDQFRKWNSRVLRGPHQKRNEESGRNNCLTPGQLELKTRTD